MTLDIVTKGIPFLHMAIVAAMVLVQLWCWLVFQESILIQH